MPSAAALAPADVATQTYHGVATYYGWDFQGRPMAAGPIFNMMDPTVTASNYWPLGTRLRIWRVTGGPWDSLLSADQRAYYYSHSIIVTVMDRGAFTHALDLSYGAFAMLGAPPEGVISVMIQPLDGRAPSWQLGPEWSTPGG